MTANIAISAQLSRATILMMIIIAAYTSSVYSVQDSETIKEFRIISRPNGDIVNIDKCTLNNALTLEEIRAQGGFELCNNIPNGIGPTCRYKTKADITISCDKVKKLCEETLRGTFDNNRCRDT